VTTTKRCPECGSEYVHSVEQCVDCEVDLVDLVDGGDLIDGGERSSSRGTAVGAQVSYELHEWSGESRMLLEQLLAGAGIARAWEGSTVVIDQGDQARVDDLMDHVEGSAGSALDPDAERIVYEVGDWTADQLTVLIDALVGAGIAYEFDVEGDVAVLADDETRVEELLDGLDFGSPESAEAEGDDVDPDDGIETAEIMSDLFVACDRLQKGATDHEGVLGGISAANRIEARPLPFGFTPSVWIDIVSHAVGLRAELEDDSVADEAIEDHARELRTLLRQYV
jgi:hypothetical protein